MKTLKYNPIGYQVVDDKNDIHPNMDASFCIYSRKQAFAMILKSMTENMGSYKLVPIKDGDIEEPTMMFEGDPETATEIVVTQTPTVEVTPRFRGLAELLLQIIIEGQEFKVSDDFKMPESTILLTAKALEKGFLNGEFKEDENGALYYSGMTEDFGGYYETALDVAQHEAQQEEDSVTVFKNKLLALAKAAEELNNAWDYVDGDPEVAKAIDIRYPFLERLYYLALRDTKNWAKNTAEKLNKI